MQASTSSLTAEIISRQFEIQNGELVIGGIAASELARRFSTPMYVYDFAALESAYQSLRHKIHPDVDVYYCLKANPSLAISAVFRELGAGAEIASLGELSIAQRAGYAPDRIAFAGPGKSAQELEASIAARLGSIHVESVDELEAVAAIAERLATRADIGLRINPAGDWAGSQLRMGGSASQFGIDEEQLDDVLARIKHHTAWLKLSGIHVYVGSQIFDHSLLVSNCRRIIELGRRVSASVVGGLRYIDLGGGLGIPYYRGDRFFDEETFAAELNAVIAEAKQDPMFAQTKFILELGRYLVARSGIFLTRVVRTKISQGLNYAVLDGGMNYCSVATGNLGQVVRRRSFPTCVANKLAAAPLERWQLVGPLCTPMDTFGEPQELPPLSGGDLIAIFHVGAYGYTTSPHNFLSHVGCPEVGVWRADARVLRQPRTVSDLLAGQELWPT